MSPQPLASKQSPLTTSPVKSADPVYSAYTFVNPDTKPKAPETLEDLLNSPSQVVVSDENYALNLEPLEQTPEISFASSNVATSKSVEKISPEVSSSPFQPDKSFPEESTSDSNPIESIINRPAKEIPETKAVDFDSYYSEKPLKVESEPIVPKAEEKEVQPVAQQMAVDSTQLQSLTSIVEKLFDNKNGSSDADLVSAAFNDEKNWGRLQSIMFKPNEQFDRVKTNSEALKSLANGKFIDQARVLDLAFDTLRHLDNTVAIFYGEETRFGEEKVRGDHRLNPNELSIAEYNNSFTDRVNHAIKNFNAICSLAGIKLDQLKNSADFVKAMIKMNDATVYGVSPVELASMI